MAALGLVVPDAQVSAVPAAVLDAAAVTPIKAALAEPEEVATAVRAELTVELGRIDATITSRLADADYAPADVSALALEATSQSILSAVGVDPQLIRDAMLLAASAGAPPPAAGSVDAKLNAAVTPADPWGATLPAGYAGQEAGAILGRLAELDTTAVTQVTSSLAGHLTITRALTFAATVSGLSIPAHWATAYWTLKSNPLLPDAQALMQVRASNPAAVEDGLLVLNRLATLPAGISAADAALTVDALVGVVALALSDELTRELSAMSGLGWDVKFVSATGDSSGARGTADVLPTETWGTL